MVIIDDCALNDRGLLDDDLDYPSLQSVSMDSGTQFHDLHLLVVLPGSSYVYLRENRTVMGVDIYLYVLNRSDWLDNNLNGIGYARTEKEKVAPFDLWNALAKEFGNSKGV